MLQYSETLSEASSLLLIVDLHLSLTLLQDIIHQCCFGSFHHQPHMKQHLFKNLLMWLLLDCLTACACLMKSKISSLRAWWILAGPLSSHRHTAWTSLWRKEINEWWRVNRVTHVSELMANLREQVKPLLFGDRLLSQQLQHYGTHQVPFIFKLKGAFVLSTQRKVDLSG